MRSRARILVVLAFAGAALGLVTPSATSSLPDSGDFTALSYNVAGLPEPLSSSEPATNSPLISPLLNEYELVLLQENWADPLADQRQSGTVPEDVPRIGYHDLVVQDAVHPFQSEPARNPYGVDPDRLPTGPPFLADGLNRLSNFDFGPLERVKWEECHGEPAVVVLEEVFAAAGLGQVPDTLGLDGGAADCGAQKGFSVARTEVAPGVEVDVYNLHAEAGSSPEGQRARETNYEQLAAFMDEFSAGNPVILGGDTNLHVLDPNRPDGDVWREFLATTGLTDVCDMVPCGADAGVIDRFAFRDGGDVLIRPLDHDFERDVFVRDDGEPLSDHDPLAVRFGWIWVGPARG